MAKVTIDDIASEAGCSRATVYRLFPGGKDNLYEALRKRETRDFFNELNGHLAEANGYEDLLVRGVVAATQALRADEHLQLMLASQPGELLADMTIDGLPRIFDSATIVLTPWFAPYIGRGPLRRARRVARPRRPLLLLLALSLRRPRRSRLGHALHRPVRPSRVSRTPEPRQTMSTEISDMIGREDVNDVEAILAITNTDVDVDRPRGEGQRRRARSRGTTTSLVLRCASCTRRPRPVSGTVRPICRGRPRSTKRQWSSRTRPRHRAAWARTPTTTSAHRSRSGATPSGSSSASRARTGR